MMFGDGWMDLEVINEMKKCMKLQRKTK